jgi:hypothetical protein
MDDNENQFVVDDVSKIIKVNLCRIFGDWGGFEGFIGIVVG